MKNVLALILSASVSTGILGLVSSSTLKTAQNIQATYCSIHSSR